MINDHQMSEINLVRNNFCAAPWVNMHIDTDENVRPCCQGAGILIPMDQIQSYIDGSQPSIIEIKKTLMKGQLPHGCQGCQERDWYHEFSALPIKSPYAIDLMSLDLRWSNTCQLNCTYCNEKQSSSWASLVGKDLSITSNRIKQGQKFLINFVQQRKNKIKRISMLGGEPLLIKQNNQILDMIDDDTRVEIFTNLNTDLQNNSIFARLSKMPNIQWYISMETTEKKFEFVRRNAHWNTQVKNLKFLLAESVNQPTVTLQSQFCAYSATSMLEFYEWADDYDVKINWNWLIGPDVLDFFYFPDRLKNSCLMQIERIKEKKFSKFGYEYRLDQIETKLLSSMGLGSEQHLNNCVAWHQQQESKYFNNAMDFLALWPEYAYDR